MGFNAPESLQAGKPGNKGFRKPKPVNMNNNSNNITKNKNKNKKWKGKKKGNPSNNALPMAVPRFNVPSLPPSLPFALQSAPAEAFFMMNGPVEARFKAHSYAMGSRNGLKKRKILARKKIYSPSLHAPLAPRNTTSFIMRAKKLGGIAPAVTPSPATPAVLPTPLLSPGVRDKGSLEEMNKELGVDGYGSMNGLIRLRSYQDRARDASESESDVEQGDLMNEDHSIHSVERLEQRIDQGLSRFEMIYPSRPLEIGTVPKNLENCVNSQERLIAHLEEENLTLKERLFLVEQELNELRQRVREMEAMHHAAEPMEEHCEESCGDVSTPSE